MAKIMNANPIKLVFVEDDTVTRTIVMAALKDKGISARFAKNGSEAYQLCVESPPDIVLSDWYMPEMDGIEFLHKIRENPELESVYFIMLTAQQSPTDVAKVLTLGADDYIKKPVSLQELVARIRTGYRVVSLLRELREQHNKGIESERLKVMLESVGAASHHLSQPLTAMILNLEMMLEDQVFDTESIKECLQLSQWMQKIINKFQQIEEYRTQPYYLESNILDIGLDQNIDQWLLQQAQKSK
jgi:DNA-binding response OmpR family regulator